MSLSGFPASSRSCSVQVLCSGHVGDRNEGVIKPRRKQFFPLLPLHHLFEYLVASSILHISNFVALLSVLFFWPVRIPHRALSDLQGNQESQDGDATKGPGSTVQAQHYVSQSPEFPPTHVLKEEEMFDTALRLLVETALRGFSLQCNWWLTKGLFVDPSEDSVNWLMPLSRDFIGNVR